jgi:hypothetical protein
MNNFMVRSINQPANKMYICKIKPNKYVNQSINQSASQSNHKTTQHHKTNPSQHRIGNRNPLHQLPPPRTIGMQKRHTVGQFLPPQRRRWILPVKMMLRKLGFVDGQSQLSLSLSFFVVGRWECVVGGSAFSSMMDP